MLEERWQKCYKVIKLLLILVQSEEINTGILGTKLKNRKICDIFVMFRFEALIVLETLTSLSISFTCVYLSCFDVDRIESALFPLSFPIRKRWKFTFTWEPQMLACVHFHSPSRNNLTSFAYFLCYTLSSTAKSHCKPKAPIRPAFNPVSVAERN